MAPSLSPHLCSSLVHLLACAYGMPQVLRSKQHKQCATSNAVRQLAWLLEDATVQGNTAWGGSGGGLLLSLGFGCLQAGIRRQPDACITITSSLPAAF